MLDDSLLFSDSSLGEGRRHHFAIACMFLMPSKEDIMHLSRPLQSNHWVFLKNGLLHWPAAKDSSVGRCADIGYFTGPDSHDIAILFTELSNVFSIITLDHMVGVRKLGSSIENWSGVFL